MYPGIIAGASSMSGAIAYVNLDCLSNAFGMSAIGNIGAWFSIGIMGNIVGPTGLEVGTVIVLFLTDTNA
jgi:hypothetical protein